MKILKFKREKVKVLEEDDKVGVAALALTVVPEDELCGSMACRDSMAKMTPPGSHAELAKKLEEVMSRVGELIDAGKAPRKMPPNSGEMLEFIRTAETLDGRLREQMEIMVAMLVKYVGDAEAMKEAQEALMEHLRNREEGPMFALPKKKEQVH